MANAAIDSLSFQVECFHILYFPYFIFFTVGFHVL